MWCCVWNGSLFLCLTFALFVSFFFKLFFSYPVKLPIWMGAKWLSVPQRELWLQLPIWQQCPPKLVCGKQSTSSAIPPFFPSLTSLPFSPVLLSLTLTGTVVTLPWIHNLLAATQASANLKLIIYRRCHANCIIFVSILNAFRPNYQQQLLAEMNWLIDFIIINPMCIFIFRAWVLI